MKIFLLLITILILLISYNLYYNYKKRKEMGCLSGKYFHVKTPRGFKIKVQYSDNGLLKYREANIREIIILEKYKYLKREL